MIEFNILTIFPELFKPFTEQGLISKAIETKQISIEAIQLRDFAINTHGQIDDTPYGGGAGMVLRADAVIPAIRALKQKTPRAKTILFSPRGQPIKQETFNSLAQASNDGANFILLCTRYEGIDQRAIDSAVDLELSLGDYVIQGGEVAAMTFIEGISRLLPGVLGNPDSVTEESFSQGILEASQYTKPQEFEGQTAPEILLSGNHKKIAAWRNENSLVETCKRRPELLKDSPIKAKEINLALMHYPVVNKQSTIITSSITLIDVSDIARSAKTFGINHFYIVHPTKTLRRLVQKLHDHWDHGFGAEYNPNRKEALSVVSVVPDLDSVLIDIESRTGELPNVISTSAKPSAKNTSFIQARANFRVYEQPQLILLGTGWGLAPEVMQRADMQLAPIDGPTDYNHLSVRAAAAIILEKLFGLS